MTISSRDIITMIIPNLFKEIEVNSRRLVDLSIALVKVEDSWKCRGMSIKE